MIFSHLINSCILMRELSEPKGSFPRINADMQRLEEMRLDQMVTGIRCNGITSLVELLRMGKSDFVFKVKTV